MSYVVVIDCLSFYFVTMFLPSSIIVTETDAFPEMEVPLSSADILISRVSLLSGVMSFLMLTVKLP